jgi:hypothetical protein
MSAADVKCDEVALLDVRNVEGRRLAAVPAGFPRLWGWMRIAHAAIVAVAAVRREGDVSGPDFHS